MSQSEFQFIEPERPKRRRWLRYFLLITASAVAVAMVTLGGGVVYVSSQLRAAGIEVFSTDGETFDLPTPEEINGPINLLLIGSDTREGQGSTAYGPVGAELADVIILLHINEARTNAVALSFPRDLMIAAAATARLHKSCNVQYLQDDQKSVGDCLIFRVCLLPSVSIGARRSKSQ